MPVITSGLMRIGRDAEVRYTTGGQPVVTLSLAYNHGKKAEDGSRATQWIEAGFWGDYAAKAAPNMLKGTLIHAVLEDVHIEDYTKRGGETGFKLAARMQSFDFATPKGDGQRQQSPAPAASSAPRARPAPPMSPSSGFDDDPDDIPF